MGIAVMPISPSSQGDRKTYPATPSRACAASGPPPLWRGPGAVGVAEGRGWTPWSAPRASPRPTCRAGDRRSRSGGGCRRTPSAASAGVCRPYWTSSAALISSAADLAVALRRHRRRRAELGAQLGLEGDRSASCWRRSRVSATALRTSRLDGRPRSVPRILPASGSLTRKLMHVDRDVLVLGAAGTPRSTSRRGPTGALRVARVGDDAERRPWCSSSAPASGWPT